MMNIPYPANIYVIDALKKAIADLENTIKTCGELADINTRMTQETKDYFKRMSAESERVIIELHRQINLIKVG